MKLIVTVNKLNTRKIIPTNLPDSMNIIGVVNKGFVFEGEEVPNVPNPSLGKWYKDGNQNYYWGGGLTVVEEVIDELSGEFIAPDNEALENIPITPLIKRKIESVVNVFETGKAEGRYELLVKNKDYNDPETKTRIVQITYGRSQTTEFGNLKYLIQDYIDSNGIEAEALKQYLLRIGKKPSLATDNRFCDILIRAGKIDPVMIKCQDRLFETKYYQPAFAWFSGNGFIYPLSLLVIYDSYIHSGRIHPFLRNKFSTVVPASGGDEKEWITNYVNARHKWLSKHTDKLLQKTIYRTECFKEQIQNNNWDLSQKIKANGQNII